VGVFLNLRKSQPEQCEQAQMGRRKLRGIAVIAVMRVTAVRRPLAELVVEWTANPVRAGQSRLILQRSRIGQLALLNTLIPVRIVGFTCTAVR
jgi:hypothetical protein